MISTSCQGIQSTDETVSSGHREGHLFTDLGGKDIEISGFTDKFMVVASEELRNSYMTAFKFIFSVKYRKNHLLSMCVE